MNRRSVLGFLGIAPTLAGQLAKQQDFETVQTSISGYNQLQNTPEVISPHEMVRSTKLNLSTFTKNKDKFFEERIRSEMRHLRSHPRIDVDIMAMKSISDVSKIYMQAKRNAENQYEENISHFKNDLNYWLQQIGVTV
jgi:hypothetical protein